MNHAERNSQLATGVIEVCRAHNVGHVFLSPGSRNTPLMLALERSKIRTTLIVDERTASFAALGWIRARGQPAALVCTSGSAPLHYGPAIAEADAASLPLLVLSADRPESLRHRGSMQTTLQANLWPELLRASIDLGTGTPTEDHLVTVDEALSCLGSAWPGPVHVNVQFDEPLWSPGNSHEAKVWSPRMRPQRAEVLKHDLPKAFFNEGARGLITVGPTFDGQPSHGDSILNRLCELSQTLGWPILAEYHSGSRRHKAGVLAFPDLTAFALDNAESLAPDQILHIGLFPTSKNIQKLLHRAGTVVHLDPRPGGRLPIGEQLETLRGDVLASLASVEVESRDVSTWAQRWFDADHMISDTMQRLPARSLFEGYVAQQVVAASRGEPLCVANSMPIRSVDVWTGYQPSEVSTYVARGVSGIDGTLAGAIGVALAKRSPVWVFLGDLALLHDVSGLAFARELKVQLRVVVCDNRGGGIFRRLPISQHETAFESHFLTPQESVNFEDIARGFGAMTCLVEQSDQLLASLNAAREAEGVAVVVVKTDSNFDVAEEARIRQACGEVLR